MAEFSARGTFANLLMLAAVGAGILALVATWRTGNHGFERFSQSMQYLVAWLPALSILAFAVLVVLAHRAGWSWVTVLAVTLFIGGGQLGLYAGSVDTRLAQTWLPIVAIVTGVAGLAAANGAVMKFVAGVDRFALPIVLAGVIAVISGYGWSWWRRSHDAAALERVSQAMAEDDRTLHGIERSAFLLATGLDDWSFDKTAFRRTGLFQSAHYGEFRWDEATRRLVRTQRLFEEDWIRAALLPHAARVLTDPRLSAGPHAELAGGVISCEPPLACRVTWTFDVDTLHPGMETAGLLRTPVSGLERVLAREFGSRPHG